VNITQTTFSGERSAWVERVLGVSVGDGVSSSSEADAYGQGFKNILSSTLSPILDGILKASSPRVPTAKEWRDSAVSAAEKNAALKRWTASQSCVDDPGLFKTADGLPEETVRKRLEALNALAALDGNGILVKKGLDAWTKYWAGASGKTARFREQPGKEFETVKRSLGSLPISKP